MCKIHCDESFIIRKGCLVGPVGSVLTLIKRDRLKLTKYAFPTNFENVSAYLSRGLPTQMKATGDGQVEIKKQQEERK